MRQASATQASPLQPLELLALDRLGTDAGDDRLLRALVEPLAATLDGAQELVEVDLEGREDAVGPVLHLEPRLARLPLRIVDDVVGLALGEPDDLGLGRLANRLLAGLLDDPVALPLRLGEHLLPLLDDPAGLLDLFGNGRPHLIEDLVDLLAVEADLVGQWDGLRVVHEVVELVDEHEYVHTAKVTRGMGRDDSRPTAYSWGESGAPGRPSGYSSAKRRATAGGTNSSTFPPNEAISFTPLEETKLYRGLAIT